MHYRLRRYSRRKDIEYPSHKQRHCHRKPKGGGTVVIPAGFWITGPIKLQSGVNLYTERNAFVLFTEDHSHYKKPNAPKHALSLSPIYADNARNIAITGHGVFDGNGNTWRMVKRSKLTAGQWKQRVASGGVVNEKEDVWYPSQAAKEGEGRPNMVRLYECKTYYCKVLRSVTLRHGAYTLFTAKNSPYTK